MVEDVGFEPRYKTPRLVCSHYTTSSILEPVTGIGPAYPAWKAGVLPLNYTDVVPNQNFTGATIADGVLRDAVITLKGGST